MERLNLTGQKFGRLLVIKESEQERSKWNCICDCGKNITSTATKLRSGHTKSCGCLRTSLRKERHLPTGEASFNMILRDYKGRAFKKGFDFSLTDDYFRKLITSICYYCGKQPAQIRQSQHYNGKFVYNGIDRLDNSLGYVEGNCVPCCRKCNTMKGELSYTEFIALLKHILNTLGEVNEK